MEVLLLEVKCCPGLLLLHELLQHWHQLLKYIFIRSHFRAPSVEQPGAFFTTLSHLICPDQTHLLPEPLKAQTRVGLSSASPKKLIHFRFLLIVTVLCMWQKKSYHITLFNINLHFKLMQKKTKKQLSSPSRKKEEYVLSERISVKCSGAAVSSNFSKNSYMYDAPFKEDGGANVVYISKATSSACHHRARKSDFYFLERICQRWRKPIRARGGASFASIHLISAAHKSGGGELLFKCTRPCHTLNPPVYLIWSPKQKHHQNHWLIPPSEGCLGEIGNKSARQRGWKGQATVATRKTTLQ